MAELKIPALISGFFAIASSVVVLLGLLIDVAYAIDLTRNPIDGQFPIIIFASSGCTVLLVVLYIVTLKNRLPLRRAVEFCGFFIIIKLALEFFLNHKLSNSLLFGPIMFFISNIVLFGSVILLRASHRRR